MAENRAVWITGVGIASSLGDGLDAHWQALTNASRAPVLETGRFAPYPVHPMTTLDLDRQIPKRGDQRQMEAWQRIGVYSAGLALDMAGIAKNSDLLGQTHMIVAAGGGERDIAVDDAIMTGLMTTDNRGAFLNERLSNDLRPTLFLAQLSNLLAGNISIVHGVVGSSRTFMGEEAAGVEALRIAAARIGASQGDLFLVGGAYNAEREDMLLLHALGSIHLSGDWAPVWSRNGRGMVTGSIGAFLVLEAREHAEARNAKPLAVLKSVGSERSTRRPGAAAANATRLWRTMPARNATTALPVISGATGTGSAMLEERQFLDGISKARPLAVRATGTLLGHGVEAQFPANIGLAAMAISRGALFPPFEPGEDGFEGRPDEILVTSFGPWRGEGLGLVGRVDEAGADR